MYKNKRKYKKGIKSSRLYVEVNDGNIERAISEFKKRVKNSNLIKEIRENEFYEKPSVIKRRKKKLKMVKIRSLIKD
jgi:small subunit ribosomal protein S21